MNPKEKRKADKIWSKEVRKDGKCEICDSTKNLNAHHLLDKRYYAEYRFEKMNGICLCVRCHKFGKHSAHKNPVWFSEWLRKNKAEQFEWVLKNM